MEQLQIKTHTMVRRVRKFHSDRLREWKESGSKGLKPKLYASVEFLLEGGFVFLETDPEAEAKILANK